MTREQHYRRLLALYPSDHRRQHGEEMLGVLLAAHGGWRDDLDLVRGAAALHLRRTFNMDGGVSLRDAMVVVSLLGPILLLSGAAPDLHEIAWWFKADGLVAVVPYEQVPDWPAWAAWAVVAVLTLFGARRPAAAMAWVACAVHLTIISAFPINYAANYENTGLLLLGVFTTIGLTWSAGPARGKELVGRRGIWLAFGGVALSTLMVAMMSALYALGFWAYLLGPWLAWATFVFGGCLACRRVPDRRTGRHAAFVLALPLVSNLVDYGLFALLGPPLFWTPSVTTALFYGIPTLMVLAGLGILGRIRRSLPN
ncbi:hypothetical protein [Kutzneria sp. 744]|uniref:hypothetical protein n=1 Tax=Kutzneria sp. (strain 744) TaxID=345341 RepID=UPI0003EEC731|nr:hypothetical protein [Kutzneria sp. 744]EWM19548.1 LigA protein [Kutzneria sp. 744]